MTTKTKERPILFSGPMVNSILRGEKTQTRRKVAINNSHFGSAERNFWEHAAFDAPSCFADDGYLHVPSHCQGDGFAVNVDVRCEHCITFGWEGTRHRLYPQWDVGDRLWVRETWADVNTDSGPAVAYKDGALRFCCDDAYPVEYERYPNCTFSMWWSDLIYRKERDCESDHHWRPSIFMPRWASRITLEITDVRVERLQDISEADAMAEGCERIEYGPSEVAGLPVHPMTSTYRKAFQVLWESINGPDSWNANTWVWVIAFKRVTA